MLTEEWGTRAGSGLRRATEMILCAVGDPVAEIAQVEASALDGGSTHVLRAALGVLGKDAAGRELVHEALADLRSRVVSLSPDRQAHLHAAALFAGGEPLRAARHYEAIALRSPRDVLALRLALSCHFFLGRHADMAHIADAVEAKWAETDGGFGYVLAMRAFAHAENGNAGIAEQLGRQALAIEPSCPYGVHAVAHALWQRGEHAQGAQWMRQQATHWASPSRMLAHNAWHLAVFELEAGRLDAAIELLDDWVLPHAADSAQDAADATALLWRLEREGLEAGPRWEFLSDCWQARGGFGFWPYLDLHAAVAFHAARHPHRAVTLEAAVSARALAPDQIGERARYITLTGLRGVRHFAHAAYPEAVHWLGRLQHVAKAIGGSSAQIDVFTRMLREAHAKGG